MRVIQVDTEDFSNYKLPALLIGTCFCDWKCAKQGGFNPEICHNHELNNNEIIEVKNDTLIFMYDVNPITKAIVFGGLEPVLQIIEILDFIKEFRKNHQDDIVIYTGYYPEEIPDVIDELKKYPNIIMKFGRFCPDQPKHFDEILGVELANPHQYAEKIS